MVFSVTPYLGPPHRPPVLDVLRDPEATLTSSCPVRAQGVNEVTRGRKATLRSCVQPGLCSSEVGHLTPAPFPHRKHKRKAGRGFHEIALTL